jgi:hypothetical protein
MNSPMQNLSRNYNLRVAPQVKSPSERYDRNPAPIYGNVV